MDIPFWGPPLNPLHTLRVNTETDALTKSIGGTRAIVTVTHCDSGTRVALKWVLGEGGSE